MDILQFIFYFLITLPSAIIHEYAHGAVADALGDPTARYAGRLTLNPISHIDLWGTILLPLLLSVSTGGRLMFAYAKPVPYNPYNLSNQRWGPVAVAIAGPISNFALAFSFGMAMRFISSSALAEFLAIIVFTNLVLGVFNLVPIPPLDGSKILYAILPDRADRLRAFLDRYGFFILIFFVLFLFQLLLPVVNLLFLLFTGGSWGF